MTPSSSAHVDGLALRPRSLRFGELLLPLSTATVVGLALLRGANPIFAAAFLATLVGVVVAVSNPFVGLQILLVASVLVDGVKRLLLAAGTPTSLEWFGTIALPDFILLGILVGVLFRPATSLSLRPLRSAAGIAVLALFGWMTVRTLWTSAALVDSVGKWKLTMPYVLLFFVAPDIVPSVEKWERFLRTLIAVVAISAWYGIWQGVFGMTAFEERWLTEGYTTLTTATVALYGVFRPFSTFSDAGAFAYALAICIAGVLMTRRSGTRRWWNSWVSVSAMAVALLLTVVRSGWLLLIIGVVAVSRATRRQRRLLLGAVLGCALLAGVLLTTTRVATRSQFLARSLTLGTYGSRLVGYANLFQMGIIGFVSGQGVASMPFGGKRLSGMDEEELVAHDFFTETLYEIGWIGVACWSFALIGAVRGRHEEEWRPHVPFLRFLVLGVPLIAALFGPGPMEARPLLILLWLSAGLLVARREPRSNVATAGDGQQHA